MVNSIVSNVLDTMLISNIRGFVTVKSSRMNSAVKNIAVQSVEYTIYLLHLRLLTPGIKSSGIPLCANAESNGLRMKPNNVAAAALMPGVLQNISTHTPKRKLHISSSLRVVWRGNLMMKMMYMHAVA